MHYRLHRKLENWQSEVLAVTLNGFGALPCRINGQQWQALERDKREGRFCKVAAIA